MGFDGTFVVRSSKNGGEYNPYTLTIYYNESVFHINVRYIPGGKFALGKSKPHEQVQKYLLSMCNDSYNRVKQLYFYTT